MNRYQTIIVAAALDDRDATTLRHAARFAQAAQSKTVCLTHVAPSFDLPQPVGEQHPELARPVDEEIELRLKATLAAQSGLFPPATHVHCDVRQGSLVPELVRLAAQKSADLVCVGRLPRADHDPLSDAVVKIVREAPCSVFVVPAGVEPQYERILVSVDFSDRCCETLDVAAAVAACTPGASLIVQHVYTVPTGYHKTGRTYEDFALSMKGLAERQWAELVPKIDFRGVPWSVRFDLGDRVPKNILAVADKVDAQLIVMGSHGRTRPSAVLLGHAADSVCSRTMRPFLCVKRKGEVVHLLHALLELFELG
jgi:nucleotide-binding universal stress UspA family protein